MSENEHPGITAGWIRLLSQLEARNGTRNGSYAVLRLVRDPSRPRDAGETFSTDANASDRLEE